MRPVFYTKCREELILKVIVTLSVDVLVSELTITKEIDKYLEKEFSIANPQIETMKRLGKRCYGIPKRIYSFYKNELSLSFGKGDLSNVLKMLDIFNIEYEFRDESTYGESVEYSWSDKFKLRDYQRESVDDALKSRCGSIIIPAGGGKTVVGMRIIKELGKKALWITHTKDLMQQSAKRAESALNEDVGFVGAGRESFGNITIATIQTLARRRDVIDYLNRFIGVIIIDEAHHIPTEYFTTVLSRFSTNRVYGLTATPIRKDKLDFIMNAAIGSKISEIDRKMLYSNESLIVPELRTIYTDFDGNSLGLGQESINLGGDSANWHGLVKALTDDEKRMDLIVETIASNYLGQRTVCLVEWIAYGEKIMAKLKERLPEAIIHFAHGSTHQTLREDYLDKFSNNEIDILFASRIAREGLDLPNITHLHLLTPKKGDSKTGVHDGAALEQEIGRAMRPDPKNPSKKAVVFDYIDYDNGILKTQWYTRRRVYDRLGINIPKKERNNNYLGNLFPGLFD